MNNNVYQRNGNLRKFEKKGGVRDGLKMEFVIGWMIDWRQGYMINRPHDSIHPPQFP